MSLASITLVVTSCNRHDLLLRTLTSFVEQNHYPIMTTIIIEDGPAACPEKLKTLYGLGHLVFINRAKRRGQIYSIDEAYAAVGTPWIFHTEDDWKFIKPDFIEKSLEILEAYPEIFTVNLRHIECNGHVLIKDKYPFSIQQPYWGGLIGLPVMKRWRPGEWGGFTFNPGLRRLSDYKKHGPYGQLAGYESGFAVELALSKMYLDWGYRIASLDDVYVTHIGEGRSRASEKI